jgi:hypothetical protein
MKKHFATRLFASLAATFAITFLFAQDKTLYAANHTKPEQIKTIATPLNNTNPSPATATVNVKAKVMRSFLQLFADATEVKWSESNGRYFASFNQNGKPCKALFDGTGRLVFNMRYGTEKDLPRDVRRLVKSTYIDFTIGVVTEVDSDNLKTWVVNLSDNDNLIIATVHDRSLYELHHYKTHF